MSVSSSPHGRKVLLSSRSRKNIIIHTLFANDLLEKVHPRVTLATFCFLKGLQFKNDLSWNAISFAWSFNESLKDMVYQPKNCFLGPIEDSCNCASFPQFHNSHFPHVVTCDLSLINSTKLRLEFGKGLNHIPLALRCRANAFRALQDTWLNFSHLLNLNGFDRNVLNLEFKNFIQQELSKLTFTNNSNSILNDLECSSELNFLTKFFFISGVDKSPNNPCFICKKLFLSLAINRVNDGDFVLEDRPLNSILALLASYSSSFGPSFPSPSRSLPYLMGIFKAHKNDFRWLTNAANCCYSSMANFLRSILLEVMIGFQEICNSFNKHVLLVSGVKIQSFWVINSALDIPINLPSHIFSICAGDIKKCYECIPHDGIYGLKTICEKIFSKVFKFKQKGISWSNNSFS